MFSKSDITSLSILSKSKNLKDLLIRLKKSESNYKSILESDKLEKQISELHKRTGNLKSVTNLYPELPNSSSAYIVDPSFSLNKKLTPIPRPKEIVNSWFESIDKPDIFNIIPDCTLICEPFIEPTSEFHSYEVPEIEINRLNEIERKLDYYIQLITDYFSEIEFCRIELKQFQRGIINTLKELVGSITIEISISPLIESIRKYLDLKFSSEELEYFKLFLLNLNYSKSLINEKERNYKCTQRVRTKYHQ